MDYPFPRTELTISTNDDPANEPYDSDVDQDQGWCASSKATLQEGQILKSGYLMKKGERIKVTIEQLKKIRAPTENHDKAYVGWVGEWACANNANMRGLLSRTAVTE